LNGSRRRTRSRTGPSSCCRPCRSGSHPPRCTCIPRSSLHSRHRRTLCRCSPACSTPRTSRSAPSRTGGCSSSGWCDRFHRPACSHSRARRGIRPGSVRRRRRGTHRVRRVSSRTSRSARKQCRRLRLLQDARPHGTIAPSGEPCQAVQWDAIVTRGPLACATSARRRDVARDRHSR